jgi:hypothetical protein
MEGHYHIPIPLGLQVPENAAAEPFTAEVDFILMGDKLMPLAVAGIPIYQPESAEYEEGYEEEGEYEKEEDGCCGAYKKGPEHMCPECPKRGNMGGGFLIAIEQALTPKKGGKA